MEKCSIVVPCYNEEEALPFFYEAVEKVIYGMQELEFEYIFVDDGSRDQTLSVLRTLSEKDEKVHYISFSRNFGKEAGILAGLTESRGDYVVIMDADLQDPPELLPELYKALKEEGYDCAATRRVNRKGEPPIRSFFARMFYRIMNRIVKLNMMDGARDYRFMKRVMVDAILSMMDFGTSAKWLGSMTNCPLPCVRERRSVE